MNDERFRRGDDSLQEIAGLWERTSAGGREYIGGRTSEEQDITIPAGSFVMVFPNDSDNPRAPGFRLLFSPPREGGSAPAAPAKGRFDKFKGTAAPAPQGEGASRASTGGQNPVANVPDEDLQDDDIPF